MKEMTDVGEEKQYHENLTAARKELADALERVLSMFPERQNALARVDMAGYALGYLGVSWGLKYG